MADKVGSIPEEITYVFNKQVQVATSWDTHDDDAFRDVIKRLTVTPAYPVAAGNKKRLESAKRWAGRNAKEITKQNTPCSLEVCGLEVRDKGGRAYKVVDEDGYYFDLREDVLLEALLSVGCQKDGKLNGKYLWCIIGSQTKLVREGSKLHEAMIQADELHKTASIKKSDLVPGDVYLMKSQERRVFIGTVTDGQKDFLLWFEVFDFNKNKVVKSEIRPFYYRLTKDCNVIKKIGESKIDAKEMLTAYLQGVEALFKYHKKCIAEAGHNRDLQKLYEESYEKDKKVYSKVLALTGFKE